MFLLAGLIALCAGVRAEPQDLPALNPPGNVLGNLFVLGVKDGNTAFLITTAEGHILINSGMPDIPANSEMLSPPLIRKQMRQLGLRYADIKVLLLTHAHAAWFTGHADIRSSTGARVIVMKGDDEVVRSGIVPCVPGVKERMAKPTAVDEVIGDGGVVEFGGTRMVAHRTAGHTLGATTWELDIKENGHSHHVVMLDSGLPYHNRGWMFSPGYDPADPSRVALPDAIEGLRILRGLTPDITLIAAGGSRIDGNAAFQAFLERKRLELVQAMQAETAIATDPAAWRASLSKSREDCVQGFGDPTTKKFHPLYEVIVDPEIVPAPAPADALFREFDRDDAPGIMIGVAREGRPLYTRAFGMADIQHKSAMTMDHTINAGSVSKHFTAFAVALLVQQGKIALDADARTYLPDFPQFSRVITVRHLLHHTSGLRDHYPLFEVAGQSIRNENSRQQTWNLVRRQMTLNFEPGTEYQYSNTNYVALAELVARVSGKTFREFMLDNVFAPLQMQNSSIYDDASQEIPRIAESYSRNEDGSWRRFPRRGNYVGSTGLHTTAEDLLKWTRSWTQTTAGAKPVLERFLQMGSLDDGRPINYGFGLTKEYFKCGTALVHDGADAGNRALLSYFPEADLTIAILANAAFDLEKKRAELVDLFLGAGCSARIEAVPAATEPRAALLAALSGEYQTAFDPAIELAVTDGKLTWQSSSGDARPVTFRADETFDLGAGPRRRGNYFVIRKTTGASVGIEQVQFGVNRRILERVTRVHPEGKALRALSGEYRSRELAITYTLVIGSDGKLAAQLPWIEEPLTLEPVSADRFEWGLPPNYPRNVLTVRRKSDGSVDGLLMHVPGRFRNLLLERISE